MLNIQIEVSHGTVSDADALAALRVMQRVVEKHEDTVVQRIKLRVLWGLARPSFAIRVRHFRPFLRWLAERATGQPLDPPVTEE